MKSLAAAALVALALVVSPGARSQDTKATEMTDAQALRAAVKADRRAFVASALALNDAEAKRFWPIYEAYQRGLDAANRQRSVAVEGLIGRDKPMSDLFAKRVATDLIAADEAELKARRTMHNRVLKALPATKAARYLQLESKIRAVQAYDIATGIPLLH